MGHTIHKSRRATASRRRQSYAFPCPSFAYFVYFAVQSHSALRTPCSALHPGRVKVSKGWVRLIKVKLFSKAPIHSSHWSCLPYSHGTRSTTPPSGSSAIPVDGSTSRRFFGLRWHSAAATPLSHIPKTNKSSKPWFARKTRIFHPPSSIFYPLWKRLVRAMPLCLCCSKTAKRTHCKIERILNVHTAIPRKCQNTKIQNEPTFTTFRIFGYLRDCILQCNPPS